MCKCRSHGTFPLRLQSSHLNICYYHQDLHRRPLRPARALGFAATAAPPTHRGLALAPTAGYRSRASAPSIFGLVDSAVGHRNPLPVHPASPVLLTKNGPLGASIPWDGSTKQPPRPTYLKFENSYPEGNFGGNQLLDGSISLSPLYPSQTNDLHVSIAAASTRVSSGFAPLRHSSPSFGPDRHAHTRTLLRRSRSVGSAPVRDPTNQLPYALRVYSPADSHTCQTPWSVFQDGSNGEPTGRRPEHADAEARREARAADHD
ncbi:hypothetical protein Bca101_102263 [Brassica carinata]